MTECLCLQDQTGSCGGCNILRIANERVHRNGPNRDPVAIRKEATYVEKELCPSGRIMQKDRLRPTKTSIW